MANMMWGSKTEIFGLSVKFSIIIMYANFFFFAAYRNKFYNANKIFLDISELTNDMKNILCK